jgi:hypothetical protein
LDDRADRGDDEAEVDPFAGPVLVGVFVDW